MKKTEKYLQAESVVIQPKKYDPRDVWKAQAYLDAYKDGYEVALSLSDVVGRSEQLFCDCSQGKGVDIDEDGFPYCIDCQKNIAK